MKRLVTLHRNPLRRNGARVRVRKTKPSQPFAIPKGAAVYGTVRETLSQGQRAILVYGEGGPGTGIRVKKGAFEIALPSTTIVGVPLGPIHVAWDGIGYKLCASLREIQADDKLTLIGSVENTPASDEGWLIAEARKGRYAASGVDITSASPLMIMAEAARRGQPTVPERPPLPRILCDQIDLMLYKVDKEHFRNLASMQVPHEIPPGEPRPPKRPAQLLNQLQWYASVLFTREVEQYGAVRRDAQYEFWLSRLADRLIARVADAVDEVDRGSNTASLKYHGLTKVEMVAGLEEILSALVRKYVWEQSPEFLTMKAQMAESPAVEPMPAPVKNLIPEESVAEQIKRLRIECRLTWQNLADALGVDVRSIHRHRTGAIPRATQIAAYEKLFSEKTGRPVTLKRQ
jgi:hypothetical protein